MAATVLLLLAVAIAWRAGVLGDRAALAGLVAFAGLTVLADVILTHAGVFTYASSTRSGVQIDRMPLEDLEYGIALYLVAVTSWGGRDRTRAR